MSPKNLADIPLRHRWPKEHSLKATILLPVRPPAKDRARVDLEAKITSNMTALVIYFASLAEDDPIYKEMSRRVDETVLELRRLTAEKEEEKKRAKK